MLTLLGRLLGIIITLLFITASALLALGNPDAISLSLWPLDISLSLPIWLVITASFGIGLLIGGACHVTSYNERAADD